MTTTRATKEPLHNSIEGETEISGVFNFNTMRDIGGYMFPIMFLISGAILLKGAFYNPLSIRGHNDL